MPPPPAPATAPVLHHLMTPLLATAIALLAFLFLSLTSYRRITRKRTVPADLKPPFPPQRFSFSLLCRATDSFSVANRLGQGGFGSVYKGVLHSGQEFAVKLMRESSIQGAREFHNELSLATSIDTVCCPHIVCLLGFSTADGRKDFRLRHYGRRKKKQGRKLVLVYEYLANGSLQDALLDRKVPDLMHWSKRFAIMLAIAKGLSHLHNSCDPPIIHGDIKPSNILLDCNFAAKIADFGLAQVLTRGQEKVDDCGSIIEENGSLAVEDAVVVNVEQSPESCCVMISSPSEGLEKEISISELTLDRSSDDSWNRRSAPAKGKSESRRDWWWKQETIGVISDSVRVKDYVMEWIGSEVNKERPKKEWIKSTSLKGDAANVEQNRRGKKKLEWWESLDRETRRKERKNRKPREWWKEEFCEELTRKKKKREHQLELWWQRGDDDDDDHHDMPERKRKSRKSCLSIDRWLDGFSGEFRFGRRNSQDYHHANAETPKSGGISSTPSTRGTVCYIAPEYSVGGQASDKCDVYSFGVVLLVVVSGRRPLQVMASPMSEFERANLVSWARQLAVNGRLFELVDPNIQSLDRDQALLCITIALLCLQRSPNKRPTIKEIMEMLSGHSEPPQLPFEFSPSPPSDFPVKSRRKAG